jgi:hypothetical protein
MANRDQLTRFEPVSQISAIYHVSVADLAGANRFGIDPVDEGVGVEAVQF